MQPNTHSPTSNGYSSLIFLDGYIIIIIIFLFGGS
jgi:hypothetical protein